MYERYTARLFCRLRILDGADDRPYTCASMDQEGCM